mmetsp:Transcript_50888/g.136917  ORF Transcript_50888/g.136917 Transcript_50888/m.136917 type:complete len:205 (-) Transcript_50888:2-616(-)
MDEPSRRSQRAPPTQPPRQPDPERLRLPDQLRQALADLRGQLQGRPERQVLPEAKDPRCSVAAPGRACRVVANLEHLAELVDTQREARERPARGQLQPKNQTSRVLRGDVGRLQTGTAQARQAATRSRIEPQACARRSRRPLALVLGPLAHRRGLCSRLFSRIVERRRNVRACSFAREADQNGGHVVSSEALRLTKVGRYAVVQ